MTFSKIDELKLIYYVKHYGQTTTDEALQIAVGSEQFCKMVGVSDPAWEKFKKDELEFFKYAELLEKQTCANEQYVRDCAAVNHPC